MSNQISKNDLLKLAQLIREETGNQVLEKNFPMVESRIKTHFLRLGFNTMEQYWAFFAENEDQERGVLQGLMTTHYTFFFREFIHFEQLGKWIDSNLNRISARYRNSGAPFRIWSAACSRGHEVYSLAMFLEASPLKALGVPFEIVGTDIDPESVKYAKNGVYPLKEVNAIPHIYLRGYWKKGSGAVKDFAAVVPEIKSKTRFEVVNLMEVDTWADKNSFDIIFCRNVFIYFNDADVRKIGLSLKKRLSGDGLFISGLSEPLRFPDWNLKTVGPSCYQAEADVSKASPSLKVVSTNAATTSNKAPSAVTPAPVVESNGEYKVLCVDDSPTIQKLMKKIFGTDPKCKMIDVAGNGKEARAKLDSGKYDLITLDIHMPIVNGIEFLEQLYKRQSDPPVIMVSSVNRTDIDLATKSLSLGAFDYVEKPAMNNIEKSMSEILTKAKMAIRAGAHRDEKDNSGYDVSIGQKIVVPDASTCLRAVVFSSDKLGLLEQVVRGQKNEYRSPALVIFDHTGQTGVNLAKSVLEWTTRQVVEYREGTHIFKPNSVYIAPWSVFKGFLDNTHVKNLSLQFLSNPAEIPEIAKWPKSVQVLVDEAISGDRSRIEARLNLKVSDITPATSFPSLSVEYFANLRKAA